LVESEHSDSDRPAALGAVAIATKFAELKSSPTGLTSDEAKVRLARDGPNVIAAKDEPLWHKLFGYFWGPIPWMIEAATVISLARRDWADFIVVFGLLIYNAAVGFWQEAKAASALAALRKGLALKARVLRDGKWESLDARASRTFRPARSCLPIFS
jgi:H+-transporting ATPase